MQKMGYRGNKSMYPSLYSAESFDCPRCHERLVKDEIQPEIFPVKNNCSYCGESTRLRLSCYSCSSKVFLCEGCIERYVYENQKRNEKADSDTKYNYSYLRGVAAVVVLSLSYMVYSMWQPKTPSKINILDELTLKYPRQKSETWHHILSVLEVSNPTVKSIVLLHGDDSRTSDCLKKQLALVYLKDKQVKPEEITLRTDESEFQDYGHLLEHYRPLVKKHRIFMADLNKVKANTAQIFHTLCDEVSSDIKPSLFIFTLQYNKDRKHLRPIERATTTLKELWSELPDNVISPLLVRVVKIVADVVPEKEIVC